jgi:hypothetical protein
MKYASAREVTDEILRIVPIYRDLTRDGTDGEGIWDAGRFPLARLAPDYRALDRTIEPVRTLHLDHLEARFERWFDRILEEARDKRTLPVLQ